MTLTIKSKIGEWVAENIQYATVFDENKIDFCCGGNKSLEEVCKSQGIDANIVMAALNTVKNLKNSDNANDMELAELTEYIQKEFHEEIRTQIPTIQNFIDKVCTAHGDKYNELFEIKEILKEGFEDLLHHMEKEEQVLFPLVRNLTKDTMDKFILNPIAMMECEHNHEGERYKKIAKMTNNYIAPEDACHSFIYLYKLLKDFEQRLHLHIHIENNILFPKIKKLFQN